MQNTRAGTGGRFINEDKGLLTFSTVLCNTVQNRVEDDKHTDRHKLLAEVKNVITDKSVIRINIGWLCKGIQRTVSKQLDSKGGFPLLPARPVSKAPHENPAR